MKLIIDIPENEYNNGTLANYFGCYSEKLDNVINNGVSSDEKTNGDMICALYPKIAIYNVFGGDIWFKVDNAYLICKESWWNSPYKEGNKDDKG